MSEENRVPEDAQPLARSLDEQQLARPVVRDQEEAEQAEVEAPVAEEPEAEQQQTSPVEDRGPIGKAADKAIEKGLLDESTVRKAEEKGLIAKAEEAVGKAKDKLTGG